jgi:hypothetical protein
MMEKERKRNHDGVRKETVSLTYVGKEEKYLQKEEREELT